jgi:nucleotide-binding universal stress UspA family protein
MGIGGSGRVVVGVSNTLAAYEALRFAVEAARELRTSLIAVRAVRTTPAADTWAGLRQTLHEAAAAEVARAFEEALGGAPGDVDVTVVTESGSPHRVLPDVANRPDDLLVVGATHRPWPMTGLGGVGGHCARVAACPVVVVPARAVVRSTAGSGLGRGMVDEVEEFLRRCA